MSSPRSPQPADGLAALGDAVRQVAEASLFACAEPCAVSRTAGLLQARPPSEPWLTAAVAFTGPFEGVVRVMLPGALAGDLAGAFCGTPPDALDAAQVVDFAGELANMVCGRWLTQTHRRERFELAAPVVGPAAPADVAALAGRDAGTLGIVLNDTPVLVRLTAAHPVTGA
jgi:hypothetical protein